MYETEKGIEKIFTGALPYKCSFSNGITSDAPLNIILCTFYILFLFTRVT